MRVWVLCLGLQQTDDQYVPSNRASPEVNELVASSYAHDFKVPGPTGSHMWSRVLRL